MVKEALLVIDVQNDFCPGGALPVPEGDKVVKPINELIEYALTQEMTVIFTKDWHPEKTIHFAAFGGKWPKHCIANTQGAKFYSGLNIPKETMIFLKGMGENEDSYSGFDGKNAAGMRLSDFLKKRGVERLIAVGLATDYCVKSTVLDALKEGFGVVVPIDAIKAVNIQPDDGDVALKEMMEAGAELTSSFRIQNYSLED